MTFGEEAFPKRAIERYGGKEAVGSVLWLEHTEGIKYKAEDGSEHFLTPKDLVADEVQGPRSPGFTLKRAMKEDASMVTRETWLRNFVLRMLPVKITGAKDQPPLIFNADLEVFTVPQGLTVNPGVIKEVSVVDDQEGKQRDLTKEQGITFALRLTPEQGYVEAFGYYPGAMDSDYGIGALEITPDLIRMQLHHRIYAEIYRKPPTSTPGPLIAPHQF